MKERRNIVRLSETGQGASFNCMLLNAIMQRLNDAMHWAWLTNGNAFKVIR